MSLPAYAECPVEIGGSSKAYGDDTVKSSYDAAKHRLWKLLRKGKIKGSAINITTSVATQIGAAEWDTLDLFKNDRGETVLVHVLQPKTPRYSCLTFVPSEIGPWLRDVQIEEDATNDDLSTEVDDTIQPPPAEKMTGVADTVASPNAASAIKFNRRKKRVLLQQWDPDMIRKFVFDRLDHEGNFSRAGDPSWTQAKCIAELMDYCQRSWPFNEVPAYSTVKGWVQKYRKEFVQHRVDLSTAVVSR